jgi:CAAX protease family protein
MAEVNSRSFQTDGVEPGGPPQGPASDSRSLAGFLALLLTLSIPFWVAGALNGWQLLPGLPLSALGFICPGLAAAIIEYKQRNIRGVRALLGRAVDWSRIPARAWYVPIILLKPALDAMTYAAMRLAGDALPAPEFSAIATIAMFGGFFIGAIGEELGWSGYAIDRLQARWNALEASILLGLIWAVIHWIPLVETGRSLSWIAWWSVGTVAWRVLITWLYNGTGRSVFAATLAHAAGNVSWQLFPVHGSYWDPRLNGMLTVGLAVIVTVGCQTAAPSRRDPRLRHNSRLRPDD